MNIDTAFDVRKMSWLPGVHLAFVIAALLPALSDRCSGDDRGGE
jgi:hypothetical protein